MKHTTPRVPRGFTLIELLVVIAIIAILAAILFPVFAQAREKARAISSISNTKQLNLGFQQYTQDYDENFPYWNWENSYSPGGKKTPNHLESVWYAAIYPYVKSGGVFRCPDANDHNTMKQNNNFGWSTGDIANTGVPSGLWDSEIDYGISEPLHNGSLTGNGGTGPTSLAALQKPAQTLLVADCATALTAGGADYAALAADTNRTMPEHNYLISRVAFPNIPSGGWNNTSTCGGCSSDKDALAGFEKFKSQARHTYGTNIGFADGHSKWVRSDKANNDLFAGTQ